MEVFESEPKLTKNVEVGVCYFYFCLTYNSQHRYFPSRSWLFPPYRAVPLCKLSRLVFFQIIQIKFSYRKIFFVGENRKKIEKISLFYVILCK